MSPIKDETEPTNEDNMTNSTFDITINTDDTGPLSICIGRRTEGDDIRSLFGEDLMSDETLALVMAATAAAKATGESVTIGDVTVAPVTPVAPLFDEEFIAWSKGRAGQGRRTRLSHSGNVTQDVQATMPTAVFERTDYDGVVRRITLDASANITSHDGERRSYIYFKRTFTVERRLKDGGWGFHSTWAHADSHSILDVVEGHLGYSEDMLSIEWASLFGASYDSDRGYFTAIHEHGSSESGRRHAEAVASSLIGLGKHLNGAIVEWEVED